MSASNQPDRLNRQSSGDVPVLQPRGTGLASSPEIVWSSPITTGSGLGSSLRRAAEEVQPAAPGPVASIPAQWDRTVYAFESDLLDSAFVHWDGSNRELTLEMIPGFKPEVPPAGEISYRPETIASGPAALPDDQLNEHITRVDPTRLDSADATPGRHHQPDLALGIAGPHKVRTDGIEDPRAGWRPTGMVFFETLATPPRGTIYSSSLLDAFMDSAIPPAAAPGPAPEDDLDEISAAGTRTPFFDFPESAVPVMDPHDEMDEDEDYVEEVVIRSGSNRGDGSWFFRFMGKSLLILLIIVGLFALIVGGTYVYYIQQRITTDKPTGRFSTVIIKPGESFRTVIDGMRTDGLLGSFMGLDDRYLMRYLAYIYENSSKVKPGVYKFDQGTSLNNVYERLIEGSKDFKITVAEGKTAHDIAKQVAGQYPDFSAERFMTLVNDPAFIKELGVDAPSLEGYLYPSTYYYGPGMKEEELLRLMVSTFQDKVKSSLGETIDSNDPTVTQGLTFQQHIILASLIEREARTDEDRPIIASVIYNRLAQGMPLQIDATVNYALDSWRRLTNADYLTDHPYNTYKIKGLPPGPITTPRIETLKATYEPASTNYLYYVHKGDGSHAFAETYSAHLANVGRYIREKNISTMGNAPAAEGTGDINDQATVSGKTPAMADSVPVETPTEATPAAADKPKTAPTPRAKSY